MKKRNDSGGSSIFDTPIDQQAHAFTVHILTYSMIFGLKPYDLIIGAMSLQAAVLVILGALLFAVAHFTLFTAIPLVQIVFGTFFLFNARDIESVLVSVPIVHSYVPKNGFDDNTSVFLGFLLTGLAWNSYHVGFSSSPLTKSIYGLIFSISSGLLLFHNIKGL